MLRKLFNDEAGFVVSAELALIVTLVFTAVAVGVAVARDALVAEYNDISDMIGTMDQSYTVVGHSATNTVGPVATHGTNNSFGFADLGDSCDCDSVALSTIAAKTQVGGKATSEVSP
ncbi:hypothetical protein GC176_20345 [bacterium]|nr:hypothetical protein [bacterium]